MASLLKATAWITAVAASVVAGGSATASTQEAAAQAAEILHASGVQGGLVVHLGCGGGRLTAALHANHRYTVHGLDQDPEQVARARAHIRSLGLYGPVSVEAFSGPSLPYTDHLINLMVVEDPGQVAPEEIQRVVAPGGSVWVRQGDGWSQVTKPWPETMDPWGHFLHDATNNAVARDQLVGPPRCLQWVAPPLWLRSHETPSGVQAAVSAGGRLFYFFDEGLIGITDERIPDRWSLVCRDAFNGRLLWKRSLGPWGWRQWSPDRWAGKDWTTLRGGRTDVPADIQRRLVADGDRLYATLAYDAPLAILDAATGEILCTVEGTRGTREILVSDGLAVAYVRPRSSGAAARRGRAEEIPPALVAVDAQIGGIRWRRQVPPIRPLALAIDQHRVIYLAGNRLTALRLEDGQPLWQTELRGASPRTMVAVDGVVVMQGGSQAAAWDASNGSLLWQKTNLPRIGGGEGDDLFVVDGQVYRGMLSIDDSGKPVGKSPHVLVIGWDLRTGEETNRIRVANLRSPEHHHRCYRNKATCRYLISSFEGAEFLDFQGDSHGQNNWIRGACRYGMMPANGLLYVPPDQCFCQPGAKLLGYAAVKAEPEVPRPEVSDRDRRIPGPAYPKGTEWPARFTGPDPGDWPTFRHDPARHGTTPSAVPAEVRVRWKTRLTGPLTAAVVADGKLLVAERDAHTVRCLDAGTGQQLWHFTAGGRVDSPPTLYRGLALFGSADGRVYCLRLDDGQLVWKFLAAPADRRIGSFGQIESAWPVHGSVLVYRDVAYVTAGRSTYLDGGIRLWGLDPATGKVLHQGLLAGPHRSIHGPRDLAFFTLGANSEILAAEGGFLYMRQKKLTPELEEIKIDVLSSKGAQDVGLHVFSTAGLLDGSWYNRTFWMYSRRWPGFQLANQAPKTGQLLVVDDQKTYALRVFYRRNTHSPMFFPGKEGYLVFADSNTNEPQIVGEPGSRPPVRWLPQSDYSRGRGNQIRKLESEAFGLDKMVGYTRAEPPVWMHWLPVRVRGMVKAGETLFVAGPPDEFDPKDPYAAFEGRRGAVLVALDADDGTQLAQTRLASPPVFDGLIAAAGRLFASLKDGTVVCLAGP